MKNKGRTFLLFITTICIVMIFVMQTAFKPDAISSMNYDDDEIILTISANKLLIIDEDSFMDELLEMYDENAFSTILLSKKPEKVVFNIYHWKWEIGNKQPIVKTRTFL